MRKMAMIIQYIEKICSFLSKIFCFMYLYVKREIIIVHITSIKQYVEVLISNIVEKLLIKSANKGKIKKKKLSSKESFLENLSFVKVKKKRVKYGILKYKPIVIKIMINMLSGNFYCYLSYRIIFKKIKIKFKTNYQCSHNKFHIIINF